MIKHPERRKLTIPVSVVAVSSALQILTKVVHDLAISKGWYDEQQTEDEFIERTCNNMHDEVSELHTAWRNGELNELCDKAKGMLDLDLQPLTCLEEELADIVIRAADTAGALGIDLGCAVGIKHTYNQSRPNRHGGKKS